MVTGLCLNSTSFSLQSTKCFYIASHIHPFTPQSCSDARGRYVKSHQYCTNGTAPRAVQSEVSCPSSWHLDSGTWDQTPNLLNESLPTLHLRQKNSEFLYSCIPAKANFKWQRLYIIQRSQLWM